MKELDSFTIERLEEIAELTCSCPAWIPQPDEIKVLARIALAAKRAEPAGYACPEAIKFDAFSTCKIHEEIDDNQEFVALYTTPQLNSPKGWKLVPNMPTLGMLSVLGLTGSFEGMLGRYADMLYAAPEKENG
ncbi:TPA: hypothetical protein SJ241_003041 [Yersinia enterocolitica]|nr:hypothetical protein [Yersinia enterocolitica]HEI6761409.1 hypothetical protein [Yersinia enterocolitica]HEI6827315.1 hypothetical protein [Yersinia enterocolitica]HEI6868312.1 hypothetical protein [Yersinia enterocolitica]